MADDWAAADDDLEKLLDLDDFDVPSVFKSSEIATSLDTKEVETGPFTVQSLISNSSSPHSLPETEIVRVNVQSGEDAEPNDSADVVSEGETFVLDAREGRCSDSTISAGHTTLQLDTQLVLTRGGHESLVEVYSKGRGEGIDEGTQDKLLLSLRGNPEETPTRDEHRKRDVVAADNSTGSHVRPGVNDTDIAVVDERSPNDAGYTESIGVGRSRKTFAISQVEEEDTEMGTAPATELAGKLSAGSECKLSGKKRQSLSHVEKQRVGKISSHARETGTAAMENRYSYSKTSCTALEQTQVLSLRDSPAQMPRSPQKGDCGKRIEQQEAGLSERGSGRGLGYRIPGPAGALQENFRERTSTATHKTCQGAPDSGSQSDTSEFEEPPWITAMAYLQSEATDNLLMVTIANIKSVSRSSELVPKLVAVIKAVVPNGSGDVSVVLKVKHFISGHRLKFSEQETSKCDAHGSIAARCPLGAKKERCSCGWRLFAHYFQDPTGTISGCIHRSLLTESKYSHKVAPGAVVVLHKVAVFSPSPYAHYLNITSKNVHKLYGREVGSFQPPAKIMDDRNLEVLSDDSERPDLGVSSQRARDASGAGNLFKEKQYVPTTGEKQRSVQRPKGGESVQDTRIMHSEHTGGDSLSRERASISPLQYPNTLPAPEPDREATDETVVAAKAKAAGWDFGEDVEVLLDDYFVV